MVLSLVAGFIGSKVVDRRGEGIVLDIGGLNLCSLFVAVIGSTEEKSLVVHLSLD
jgi:uncharacterized membrane protein YeaQ/YmgE (transglycosylase-associated protein family)